MYLFTYTHTCHKVILTDYLYTMCTNTRIYFTYIIPMDLIDLFIDYYLFRIHWLKRLITMPN